MSENKSWTIICITFCTCLCLFGTLAYIWNGYVQIEMAKAGLVQKVDEQSMGRKLYWTKPDFQSENH
jgi:ATP/ADP translocase